MFARSVTSRLLIAIAAFFAVTLAPLLSFAAGLINNGTIIAAGGTLEVAPTIDNQGTIEGIGTIDVTVVNDGVISPGSQLSTTTGALTIDGDLLMTGAGTLQMDVTGIDQYDQLLVTGSATLGGTLEVSLGGGYIPVRGNSFTVMTYEGKTKAFDNVTLPGSQWAHAFSDSSLTVMFDYVPQHLLAITKLGSGMVSSSPAGINCGSTCSSLFYEGTPVTLSAVPTGGSIFTGWSGACAGAGACQVTMNAAKSVTAHFAADVALTWTNNGGTLETCVANAVDLQNALFDAEADTTPNRIKVVQGTYIGLFAYLGENYDLTLEGGYSAGCTSRSINPTLTVLDGDLDANGTGDGPVLSLDASAGAGSILVEGFKIINGLNTVNEGGGIRAFTSQGNLTLSRNFVSENTAPSGGGIAAYSGSGDIILHHNTVRGNTADYGAGILAGSETGDTILINNLIVNNLAALDGGGLATATTTGVILLLNNTIANNDALSDDGGGVALLLNSDIASADLTNNLIWGNTTGTGTCGDIYIDSDYDLNGTHAAVVLRNNDFNQATGICTTGNPPSIDPSNLSVDPLFVDPANGDYHLMFNSPVVNKGDSTHPLLPSLDIDGDDRIQGTNVDIGADEAQEVPTLISPSGTITNQTPTYTWSAVPGATQYRIYVTDGNSAVVRDETLSATAICIGGTCAVSTTTPLAAEKRYYWTVRAINGGVYGPWAGTKTFYITQTAPGTKPVLNAPKGLMSAAPTSYSWTAVDGATQYRLYVTDSNSAVVRDETLSATAICIGSACSVSAGALAPEKKYYWTVRGANTFGSGPWATTANFTITTASLPARPVLGSPTGVISSTTPSYSWPAVSGATDYILYVVSSTGVEQRNDMFSASSICSGGTCTVPTVPPLASEMKYYWTVRALNLAGFSPWASPKNFTVTSATIPGAPTPGAPSGAIGTTSPTYTWTVGASSGATKYQLYVTDSTWAVVRNQEFDASSICSGGTCTVPTTTPLGGGKLYRWKVRGSNMAGYGAWTANQTFATP